MKNVLYLIAGLILVSCHKETNPSKTDLSFKLIWKEPLTKDKAICASLAPVVFENRVVFHKMFVGPDDVLMCKKKSDGSKIWNWADPADIPDGDKVSYFAQKGDEFFVCSQNEMHRLDLLTGKSLWKKDANSVGLYGNPRMALFGNRIFHDRHVENISDSTLLISHDLATGQFQTIFKKRLKDNENYRSSFEFDSVHKFKLRF